MIYILLECVHVGSTWSPALGKSGKIMKINLQGKIREFEYCLKYYGKFKEKSANLFLATNKTTDKKNVMNLHI